MPPDKSKIAELAVAGLSYTSRVVDQLPSGTAATCSAKGCRAPAEWALHWNNPKLHAPDRRKTWLACTAHRQSLSDFLGARGFLREVTELDRA